MRPPRIIIGKAKHSSEALLKTHFSPFFTYSNLDWHRLLLFSVLVAITGMNTAHLTPPGKVTLPLAKGRGQHYITLLMAKKNGQHCTKIVTRQDIFKEKDQNPQFLLYFWATWCSDAVIMAYLAHDYSGNGMAEHTGRQMCTFHQRSIKPRSWQKIYKHLLVQHQLMHSPAKKKPVHLSKEEWFVGRLLSKDMASPGADNLVQRLTERIMNPRVGGGPQAMKVHMTNCSLTNSKVSPCSISCYIGPFLFPGDPCPSASHPGLPRRSGKPLRKAPCDGATSS